MSNCYFPETLEHRSKYMWLCVKIYLIWWRFTHFCCKIFKGLIFFWTQCMYRSGEQAETKSRMKWVVY